MTDNFDYHQFGLSAEEISDLQGTEAKIGQVQRRGTEDAFELGEHIDRASLLLGDTSFSTWIDARCAMTPRHGRNYCAVFRNLGHCRQRCIDAQVATTTLFKLAFAPTEKVEKVLVAFEKGARLKGAEVDAILRSDAQEGAEPSALENRDGLAGLRAYGTDVLRGRVKALDELGRKIFGECIIALEPTTRGKSINKTQLKQTVQLDARLAYRYLETIIGRIDVPEHWDGTRNFLSLIEPSEESGWGKVTRALYRLGGVDGIGAKELPDLLLSEILPALRWALGISEDEQAAMLDKATKAAEISSSRKARAKKADTENRKDRSTETTSRKPAAKRKPKPADEPPVIQSDTFRNDPRIKAIVSREAKPDMPSEPTSRAPTLENIPNPVPVS